MSNDPTRFSYDRIVDLVQTGSTVLDLGGKEVLPHSQDPSSWAEAYFIDNSQP